MPKKIMIIDDEPDIRIRLMAALEDNGYETCTIEENEPFHNAVLAKEPDSIALDIMMPQRSGISMYKELRTTAAFKNIPIALISGMSPAKDFMEEEFKKLIDDDTIPPPDGFIEKPVKLPALMELVEKLLE
jgi:CheY-like chemotaxis protein